MCIIIIIATYNKATKARDYTSNTWPSVTAKMYMKTDSTSMWYQGYVLAYNKLVAKLYWGMGLAMIFECLTIPGVQFGYDFHMPKHTLV